MTSRPPDGPPPTERPPAGAPPGAPSRPDPSWAVTREGPARPDLPPMGAGTLSLSQTVDASDGKPVLQL
ncbi:hypothetical protein ACFHYO_06265, partial [Paracoccus panacisoli]